jgi:hypothetical protein
MLHFGLSFFSVELESTDSGYTCLSNGGHLKVGYARFFLCLFLNDRRFKVKGWSNSKKRPLSKNE